MLMLQLSRNSPINTTLLDEEEKPVYTIATPMKLFRRTTTVTRHLFDADGQPTDVTEEMARIHWNRLTSSKLVFNGEIRDIDKVLSKGSMRSSRTFTGPDGKQYKWRIGMIGCELELVEGPKPRPIIVKMQHRFLDVFTGTKRILEIDESVIPFLDLIVMTWIYMEHTRRVHEMSGPA